MDGNGSLRRSLGLLDATALVVGCTIGAGIFRMAAPVAARLPYTGLVMAVWVMGGVISFCGALCYAELSAAYPKTGGDYVYLTKAYGPGAGFLFGWTKVFTERIGTIAILGFVFSEYAGILFQYQALGTKTVAAAAIVILTAANVIGVHVGKGVQNFLTSLKILALLAIIGVGVAGAKAGLHLPQPVWPSSVNAGTFSSMGTALVFVLWTYGGWAESTYMVEEVKHPQRILPWSILWGLTLVTALYLVVNWVYMLAIPLNEMPSRPLVAAEVMRLSVGPIGGMVTALMVSLSAVGALNGFIMTSSRILFAVGRDHPIFCRLARIHLTFSTPAVALGFNALCAIVLVWTGTLDQIATYSTVVISLFYAMTALGVIVLRIRDPQTPRPYRVWGYPLTPLFFVVAMILFIGNMTWMQPKETLFGFGLLALGLPLYAWSRALGRLGRGA